jgi:hypothetical protein
MKSELRLLFPEEITLLEKQGCTCENWNLLKVAENFNPKKITTTHFSGIVHLGSFEKEITLYGGLRRSTGISNATIFNCSIGNNVYINNIRSYIANYSIEDNVTIENVDIIAVDGESSFGNGLEIFLLNEVGGRNIPIYNHLSAQLTYILTFYRHRPDVISKIKKMINDYALSVTSSKGLIASNVTIVNTRTIKNVSIGKNTLIEDAERLVEGSINSSEIDPVYIGAGVISEKFIISSGSNISNGTMIFKCFVGQGCILTKQYSAENSAFFANCGGSHGEACSIFAGPYTITYHKSTLLISGYFSFLNAGSGSNQSNHSYKIGPVHQGIIERGSKTASDSYILWPAKVGAFTVVMGRHYRNSDTSELPFSYLIESEDESILVPGINLRSVGTIRDAIKWPNRDRRKDPIKLDYINFNLLSPYTIQKMIDGVTLLCHLRDISGETSDHYTYNSVKIKNSSLEKGIRYYNMGIDKFLGNALIGRFQNIQCKNDRDIQERLKPETKTGQGKWIDMAGLLVPAIIVNKLLQDIENGRIKKLEQINGEFKTVNDNYRKYSWTWVINRIQQRLGKKIDQMTAHDIIHLTEQWKHSVVNLDKQLIEDAKKEFNINSQIGFGLDGDNLVRQDDFINVRGKFEDNSFVSEARNHIIRKSKLGNELINRMKSIINSGVEKPV